VAAARHGCAAGLARAAETDDRASQVVFLVTAADLDLTAGDLAQAGQRLREAVELALRIGYRFPLTDCLDVCGHLCMPGRRWADAITMWAALAACVDRDGIIDPPYDGRGSREARQAAEEMLGPKLSRAAAERGAAMSLETAAEYAVVLASPCPPAPGAGLAQLSAREQELVTQVGRGRTDAEIATQLYISISTVRSHLDRIRDKTGCRRRADLTRLALQAGLV
jgi:DNA-binding CsgD family transcriptional regulator